MITRATPADTFSTAYDALGNLISAGYKEASTSGPTSPVTVGTVYGYQVDGANRRVRKLVNEGPVQGWLYRDGLAVAAELDEAGSLLNRYVYATHPHVPDLLLRGGVTYRVVTDHLGSVRAIVNVATGAEAQRRRYDAWGVLTEDTAPTFQSLGYAGGIQDRDTKLVRFGARDYDPAVGRWNSSDPAWPEGNDANQYTYANGMPIHLVDIEGLSEHSPQSAKSTAFEAYFDCLNRKANAFYGEWLAWSDFLALLSPAALVKNATEDVGTSIAERLLEDLVASGRRGGGAPGEIGIGVRYRMAKSGARLAAIAGKAKGALKAAGAVGAITSGFATGFSFGARAAFAADCDCVKLLLGHGE